MDNEKLNEIGGQYTAAWNSQNPGNVAAFFTEGTGNAVHFSGYEEWTNGEDGLIVASLGHFDADEHQHQLISGVDSS